MFHEYLQIDFWGLKEQFNKYKSGSTPRVFLLCPIFNCAPIYLPNHLKLT
jgi:hypothetical protein